MHSLFRHVRANGPISLARLATSVILIAVAMAMAAEPASANPRYAAIVYDVNSGQTLFSRNADEPRFPASITKVMTLYLLFEELEAGRMSLDTPLRVSQLAADQVPSKVGVRPGTTITVKDAVGVLVTKSANDVAVVVAENIAGSVESFAGRMTRTARALDMRDTTFRNPHGLPDSEQITTARDIVTLALAVQRDFPQYYSYFGMHSYTYAGTNYRNHNRLLGDTPGIDGLKTGFIRASGFNLVTSLRRDNKHLVGVVMGGLTGATRDAHMREILTDALPTAHQSSSLLHAHAPLPRPRPSMDEPAHAPAQTAASILFPLRVVPATLRSRATVLAGGRHSDLGHEDDGLVASEEPAKTEIVGEVGSTDDGPELGEQAMEPSPSGS